MKVVTADEMRAIDGRAQEEFGVRADDLMSEAGRAVAREIIERYQPCPVTVVCGGGDNAGDGFVVARALSEFGFTVWAALLSDPSKRRGSASRAFDALSGVGVPVVGPADLPAHLAESVLAVDAILGTGVRGPARGVMAEAIGAVNECPAEVVSIDIPSGLRELGPGEDPGPVVEAGVTVTIGLPKVALLTMPGWLFTGEMIVAPINFPAELLEDPAIRLNFAPDSVLRGWLPPRAPDSNKGSFGRVGVVAGSPECAGAAILAARAALRTGAGLVTIFTTAELNPVYKTAVPEAVTAIVPADGTGRLGAESLAAILERARGMHVLALGPGIGAGDSQAALVRGVLGGFPGAVVVDADAVTCLASPACGTAALKRQAATVLTPHPGEMARLAGATVAEVQSDRIGCARRFSVENGVTLLLKGACTVVAQPDGQVWLNPGATSALAKGGAGDVLTGMVAGMLAQGAPLPHAALLAAQVHLSAGMSLAEKGNARSVMAGDLVDEIPHALSALEANATTAPPPPEEEQE
jgi:ADP-dependent NAD(P)H-hydrate dehydratase / NAD(P)H-hydrate epimerase